MSPKNGKDERRTIVSTHTRLDVPRPHRRVETTTIRPFVGSRGKVYIGYACRMGLEFGHWGIAFSRLSCAVFCVRKRKPGQTWVPPRPGQGWWVPEPDEVVPGCSEEMGASVIGGNGR